MRDRTPHDQPQGLLPRVVIVLRSFNLGGAERQAVHLANWIHSTGDFHVRVVAFEAGSAVPSLLAPGIPTDVLHPGEDGIGVRLIGAIRFIQGLRRTRADIFIPFTDWPNKAVGAIWPLTGAKACIWNQRDEGREVTGRFIERRALKQASWFVANSESGVDFLSRRLGVDPTKISPINNAVLPLEAQRGRDHWRARLSIDPQTFVLTMVASLSRFKDHASLLKAWPVVRRSWPDSTLLLAGKDSDRGVQIREIVAGLEGVQMLGEVGDVGGVLAASDVLVHSSSLEGMPNAVLEGMAAGLPVVATDLPGTRDALGPNNRWLVSADSPNALAEALIELAQNPQRRESAGSENSQRARRMFSPEKISDAWFGIIHPLLRGQYPEPLNTRG